ncbi:hypothetical protein A5643_09805 [Mycobacterium sp. 1274756.6]|nr:hypothetical protein A5643_09805 [Mycobacterium sp. 1274756.6]
MGAALTSAGLGLAALPPRTRRHAGSVCQSGSTRGQRREVKAVTALRGFAEAFEIDLDALVQQPDQPVRAERAMSGSR